MRKHLLFVFYNYICVGGGVWVGVGVGGWGWVCVWGVCVCVCVQIFKLINTFKKRSIEKTTFAQAKHDTTARPNLCGKYYVDDCVTLNTRTAPAAPHVEFRMNSFLLASFLEQTSEEYIGKY